jgi:uncharacterized surface protein with fasciclin (FAS1) repeats
MLVVSLFLVSAASASADHHLNANVRVAHFAVDAPAVDVFVNGAAALEGVAYPAMSAYMSVPAGTYSIAVAPAGAGISAAVIGPVDLTFEAGHSYTIAAIGQLADSSFGPAVIDETAAFGETEPYNVDVLVLHGISNAPAVDIALADGTVLLSGLTFGQSAVLSVPGGSYPINVNVSGTSTTVFSDLNPVQLQSGNRYFIAAIGNLGANARLFATVTPDATLAEIISGASEFETLEAAINAAGLMDTLANSGPFTILAPSNEAFAALPAGTLDAVLADSALLNSILTYHVVNGAAFSPTVVGLSSVTTLQGSDVTISVSNGRVLLNDTVEVFITDITATNGVIHVINGVLLPQ